MPPDESSAARLNDRPIFARLEESVSNFSVGLAGQPLRVWRWSAVDLNQMQSGERYVQLTPNLNSEAYGTPPSGLAVQINGEAARGDLVMLQALPTYGTISHERWFGFYGASEPVAAGTFGVLRIINEQQVAERKWWYTVQPSRYRFPSGASSPTVEALPLSPALAWNLYEPSLYGQPLMGPNGRLEVVGPIPIGSLVLGTLQARTPEGQAFYVFAASLPLRAVCDGPGVMMMQQHGDARLMRDGI